MKFIIGFLTVAGCVFGGYSIHGDMKILWQPIELLIIFGAAIGAFIIGNMGKNIKDTLKSMKYLFKGAPYKKADYVELLKLQYHLFKTMRSKGMLELEQHIENPHSSSLFNAYPGFSKDHHMVDFLCDYLRLMTMGVEDYYQLEDLMDRELEVHDKHGKHVAHAVQQMAEGMPALGIVAAVLGVIVTMGSINEPPEILGGLIGAALVGTFLGVLISYGFVSPMSNHIGEYYADKVQYMRCLRNGLLGHVKGMAPAVSVEFARTSLGDTEKPTFAEIEQACSSISL